MTLAPQIQAHQERIGQLAGQFPTVLAVVFDDYARERNEFVRLHRLTTAVEMLTRWCAALVLADLARRPNGLEELRSRLTQSLESPSFGWWREVLSGAVGSLRSESPLGPLKPFVTRHLFPLLAANNARSLPERHVIALRNQIAHCGRLTPDDQAAYDDHHHKAFADVASAAAAAMREHHLVGRPAGGACVSMMGCPTGGPFPPWTGEPPTAAGTGDVFLFAGAQFLDLSPLVRYGDVFRFRGKGRGASRAETADELFAHNAPASPAPLLYFRSPGQQFLEFTAFSSASHSQNPDRVRFDEVYPLARWQRELRGAGASAARAEFDFSDWVRELTAVFVGRTAEVARVVGWARGGGGVGWLEGPPGSGKSALAAAVSLRLAEEEPWLLVAHFFRTTDPRCHRMKFLENAILALADALKEAVAPAPQPDRREEQFEQLLARAAAPGRRIVFLLDGLDELTRHDRTFPALIFGNRPEGVAWVCSGRDEKHLGEAFRENGATVFFPDGLRGLDEPDTRAFLHAECDRLIYDLITRDDPDAFLNVLAERSQGLPIYLRLVVDDIRSGRLTFRPGGERELPPSLREYYDNVLDRLGISDESSLLTRVLCHLAVARGPLTLGTLLAVMGTDPLVAQDGSRDLLARTLEFGHVLVRAEPLAVGAAADVGYTLYHESFRDHMLAARSPVRLGITAARAAFARHARRWATGRDDRFAQEYALRHGPAHLADANRELPRRHGHGAGWSPAALAATLLNPAFLESKAEAGMAYEVVSDFALDAGGWEGHGEAVRAYERAYAQEFHAFEPFPHTTAQQVVNNLLARYGRGAPVGRRAARWSADGPRFRRLNRAPVARPAPALTRILGGHGHPVTAVAISADGERIASADAGGSVRVWRRADGGTEAALPVSSQALAAVAWLDEARIVAAGLDGLVHIWDWRTKAGITCPFGSPVPVRTVAVVRGGFVTAGDDRVVRLWDVNGRPVRSLGEHRDRVFCAAGDAADPLVVTGGEDGALRVWDALQGEGQTFRSGARVIRAAARTPAGCAVSGSDEGAIEFWDLARSGPVQSVRAHRGPVTALAAVAADPPLLVSAGGDGTIKVFDTPPVTPRMVLTGHAYSVNAVAAVPGAPVVVSGGEDRTVRVWDVSAAGTAEKPVGHDGRVTALAVAPRGARIASGGEDGSVRIWTRRGDPLLTLRAHTRPVTAVRFVGRRIVSASEDGTVRAWSARTGRALETVGAAAGPSGRAESVGLLAERGAVAAVVNVTPDGVATLVRDGRLRAWNRDLTLSAAAEPPADVWELAAAAGERVFAAGRSGAVVRWAVGAGELRALRGPTAPASCLAAAPDGELCAGDRDGNVWLWAAGAADPRAVTRFANDWARVLCWHPEPRALLVGTDSGELRAHDPAEPAVPRWSVRRHAGPVTALVSSGPLVFSAGADGRLLATRAASGELVANVHAGQPVTCLDRAGADAVAVGTLAGEVIVFELVGGA